MVQFNKKNEEVEVQEEALSYEEVLEENRQLYEDLTNKNSEYIFKLSKRLDQGGMAEEDRMRVLNGMMHHIVEEQGKGNTARSIYGRVTDQADLLLGMREKEEAEAALEPSPDWQIYVDSALFMGSLFAIIRGLEYLIAPDGVQTAGVGLVTLILNYLVGGGILMAIAKVAPRPGNNQGFLKYILVSFAGIAIWLGFTVLSEAFITPALGIYVGGRTSLIIGALGFIARFFFKRQYNVQGGIF